MDDHILATKGFLVELASLAFNLSVSESVCESAILFSDLKSIQLYNPYSLCSLKSLQILNNLHSLYK